MKLRLLCALLILAVPAWAQTPPPAPTKDPTKIEAGTYALEPYHTRVLWAVSHFGFSTYYGEFTLAQGKLTLDPAAPAKSTLEVTIQTNNISTPNTILTGELRGPQWFDTKQFPTITFKSTKVIPGTGKDKDTAKIEGDLTMHGVTKPITLTAKLNGGGANPMSKKYTVGFEVSGKIKRSDFGVTQYVPMVGDDVDLIISAPFEKQG